jgi:hypothetical protein
MPQHILEVAPVNDQKGAAFNCDPSTIACTDDDCWEIIDPILNRVLGYGITLETVADDICRGEISVLALSRFFRYFVTEKGIKGGLLEGKIAILTAALKNM